MNMNKNLNYTDYDNYNVLTVGNGCPETCTSKCVDGTCQDKCPNGCPPCHSCGDNGCQADYDTNNCESCNQATCTVESSCDTKKCEKCDGKGSCVTSCTPCQKCDGDGNCEDKCDPDLCLKCEDGKCVSNCLSCETCKDGACVNNCPTKCEDCTEDKGCVSKCTPCEKCFNGDCVYNANICRDANTCRTCEVTSSGYSCESTCGDCQTCKRGSCEPITYEPPCYDCLDGKKTYKCKDCEDCGEFGCEPRKCPPCYSCKDDKCEPDCDAKCEDCDEDKGCLPKCDIESCLDCDSSGNCVSTCGPCEECTDGQCVSRCDSTRCEDCFDVNGLYQCSTTCEKCDVCATVTSSSGQVSGVCVSSCDPSNCETCYEYGTGTSSGRLIPGTEYYVCQSTCIDCEECKRSSGSSGAAASYSCVDQCPFTKWCDGGYEYTQLCVNGFCSTSRDKCPGPCHRCEDGTSCSDGKYPKVCTDRCITSCFESECEPTRWVTGNCPPKIVCEVPNDDCCSNDAYCGTNHCGLWDSIKVEEVVGQDDNCYLEITYERNCYTIGCESSSGRCNYETYTYSETKIESQPLRCCPDDICCIYGGDCCDFPPGPCCTAAPPYYDPVCCDDPDGLCCLDPQNKCCSDNPPATCLCLTESGRVDPCCIYQDDEVLYNCCASSFNKILVPECCKGSSSYNPDCCGNDQFCCTSSNDYNPTCCESSNLYNQLCCDNPDDPCCNNDPICCETSAAYDEKCCKNVKCCVGGPFYDKDCCEENDCCGSKDPCCGVECEPTVNGCATHCDLGNCVVTDPCCENSDPICCELSINNNGIPCPPIKDCSASCLKGVCSYTGICCTRDPEYKPECCPLTYDACKCTYPQGCPEIDGCSYSCKDGECIKDDPCCNHDCPDIDGCSYECKPSGSQAVCIKIDSCCNKNCKPDDFGCQQTCKDGACKPEVDPVCCPTHPSYDKECCDGGDCCEDNPTARLECCPSSDSYDKECCDNKDCCNTAFANPVCCPSNDGHDPICCPTSDNYDPKCCPSSDSYDKECCSDPDSYCCKDPDGLCCIDSTNFNPFCCDGLPNVVKNDECCADPDKCCNPSCTNDEFGCAKKCFNGQCVVEDPCCPLIASDFCQPINGCDRECSNGVCVYVDPCCEELGEKAAAKNCCESDDPCCIINAEGGCPEIAGCKFICKDGDCVKEDPCCGIFCKSLTGCEVCIDGECVSSCNSSQDEGCDEICVNGSCQKVNPCCDIDCKTQGADGCSYTCLEGVCVPDDPCCDPRTRHCCLVSAPGSNGCCLAEAMARAAGDTNWPPRNSIGCEQMCIDTSSGPKIVQSDPCCEKID